MGYPPGPSVRCSLHLLQSAKSYGGGGVSAVGKLQNLRVAVQRRWNNTVSDTARQQVGGGEWGSRCLTSHTMPVHPAGRRGAAAR